MNNIDEAINIYLEIANNNIYDLRAYDRIVILYRKKKDYEKETSLILQAILAVMILGNKDMDIDDIHKIWEEIVDELMNMKVIRHDDKRVLSMEMDFRLKFANYIGRFFSANLLLQRKITKELRGESAIHQSSPQAIADQKAEEMDTEVGTNDNLQLCQENDSSAKRNKKYVLYVALLIFLILIFWLIIEYTWILICVGVIVLIIWSSGSSGGGNVRSHYKKNGTYVNSYNRRRSR